LPVAVLGSSLTNVTLLWRFEVSEIRPRKLAQLALIGARALFGNNKGLRCLSPAFMRESDECRFLSCVARLRRLPNRA